MGEIGCAFLNKRQIGQVHPQVRNTRRVAAVKGVAQVSKPTVRRHDVLQFVNRLSRLGKKQCRV